jgi:predicted DNA-binding ribbon-helix-helix protein
MVQREDNMMTSRKRSAWLRGVVRSCRCRYIGLLWHVRRSTSKINDLRARTANSTSHQPVSMCCFHDLLHQYNTATPMNALSM